MSKPLKVFEINIPLTKPHLHPSSYFHKLIVGYYLLAKTGLINHVIILPVALLWLICDSFAFQLDTGNRLLTFTRAELQVHRPSLLSNSGSTVWAPSEEKRKTWRYPLPSEEASLYTTSSHHHHVQCPIAPQSAFRDICIIDLSETWLDESVSDVKVSLDNFILIRSNRMRQSGKTRGRGLSLNQQQVV